MYLIAPAPLTVSFDRVLIGHTSNRSFKLLDALSLIGDDSLQRQCISKQSTGECNL
jgi:hypothetical protein